MLAHHTTLYTLTASIRWQIHSNTPITHSNKIKWSKTKQIFAQTQKQTRKPQQIVIFGSSCSMRDFMHHGMARHGMAHSTAQPHTSGEFHYFSSISTVYALLNATFTSITSLNFSKKREIITISFSKNLLLFWAPHEEWILENGAPPAPLYEIISNQIKRIIGIITIKCAWARLFLSFYLTLNAKFQFIISRTATAATVQLKIKQCCNPTSTCISKCIFVKCLYSVSLIRNDPMKSEIVGKDPRWKWNLLWVQANVSRNMYICCQINSDRYEQKNNKTNNTVRNDLTISQYFFRVFWIQDCIFSRLVHFCWILHLIRILNDMHSIRVQTWNWNGHENELPKRKFDSVFHVVKIADLRFVDC